MTSASSPFTESAEARALQKHIADVTWDFISRWRNHRSVAGELAIINDIAHCAISSAASKWNELRAYARQLPMELFLRCWSYLDISDLLRATRVCKPWRDAITNSSELWTCLDLLAWNRPPRSSLPDLLVRSGNRKLSLRVNVRSPDDLVFLFSCLQPQASRIWLLYIDCFSRIQFVEELPFRFGMPALQSLTVRMACVLPNDFLAGNAPLLREANFHTLQLPSKCSAALEHLTSLTADEIYDLEYRAVPNLTFLEVRNAGAIRALPHVPRRSRIRHVVFSGYRGTYAELDDAGYTRLHRLEIGLFDFPVLWELLESWAHVSVSPTLEILAGNCVALTIAPYNNSLTFRLANVYETELQRLCRRDYLANLVGIAFPPPGDFLVQLLTYYHYNRSTAVKLPEKYLRLPPETLPNLLTYTVYLAPPTSPSLFDLNIMYCCGQLRAPRLRTLIVMRSPCSGANAEDVAPLCPSLLALFIAKHLRFDAEVLQELVLDGVRFAEYDDGGAAMDVLKSYVRTITIRTTAPQGAS